MTGIFTEAEAKKLSSNCSLIASFWLAIGIYTAMLGTILVISILSLDLGVMYAMIYGLMPFIILIECIIMYIKYKRHSQNAISDQEAFIKTFKDRNNTLGLVLTTLVCQLGLVPVIVAKVIVDGNFEKIYWAHEKELDSAKIDKEIVKEVEES